MFVAAAPRWSFWIPSLLVCLALGFFVLFVAKTSHVIVLCLIVVAGVVAVTAPPEKLALFYFAYLMCEGAAKIWTNYHPIIHVGSDILLVLTFARLFNRWYQMGRPAWPDERAQEPFRWVVTFLIVYWLWVGLQFFNPWGLGLLPSIAGLKLHAVPMLVFLAVAFLLKPEEAVKLPYVILLLGLAQALIAGIDWTFGPFLWAAINPRYAQIAADFIPGMAYRPFGTMHLPGAPSVWLSQSLVAALFVGYRHMGKKDRASRWWQAAVLAFFPLAIYTILGCQVRVTFLRFLLLALVGIAVAGRRQATWVALSLVGFVLLYAIVRPEPVPEGYRRPGTTFSAKLEYALNRLRTLERVDSYRTARGGTWAFDEIGRRAQMSMVGIGLSRVSASSRPWEHLIKEDRLFGPRWTFADNLFLAIFTELGAGGLAVWLLLIVVVIWQALQRGTYYGRLVACHIAVLVAAGYASEGLLFQPDASFLWLYSALSLKLREEGEAAT